MFPVRIHRPTSATIQQALITGISSQSEEHCLVFAKTLLTDPSNILTHEPLADIMSAAIDKKKKYWRLFDFLLQKLTIKSDDRRDIKKLSPVIRLAAENNEWEIVKQIWAKFFAVDSHLEEKDEQRPVYDFSAASLTNTLTLAALCSQKYQLIELVKELLDAQVWPCSQSFLTECPETLTLLLTHASVKQYKHTLKDKPISTAASKGLWDLVRLFAEHYPALEEEGISFFSATMHAVTARQYDIVELFFRRSALFLLDTNDFHKPLNIQRDFLRAAIDKNDPKMIAILLKYYKHGRIDANTVDPIEYAFRRERWECLLEFVRGEHRYPGIQEKQIAFNQLVRANREELILELISTPAARTTLNKIFSSYCLHDFVAQLKDSHEQREKKHRTLHFLLALGADYRTRHAHDNALNYAASQNDQVAVQYISNPLSSSPAFISERARLINTFLRESAPDTPFTDSVMEYAYNWRPSLDISIQNELAIFLAGKPNLETLKPVIHLLECADQWSDNTHWAIDNAIITLLTDLSRKGHDIEKLQVANKLLQGVQQLGEEARSEVLKFITNAKGQFAGEEEAAAAAPSSKATFFSPHPSTPKVLQRQFDSIVQRAEAQWAEMQAASLAAARP
jgi:hypothetical protein